MEIRERDVLVIRTGWLDEPGITYSAELIEWFHEMEIPAFATDNLASEQTHSESGLWLPLHATFIRDQGILFTKIAHLDELAADCTRDWTYDFMFVCSPLKIVGGTGSPVNPLVIK